MNRAELHPPRVVRWLWPSLLLLAVAGALLAAHIAEEIAEGDTFRSDRAILLALRRPGDISRPIGPEWLLQSAVDISALGGFTLLWIFGAAGIGYLALRRRRAEAAWLGASLVGASIIDTVLKSLFDRARPDPSLHLAFVANASFPSGHAMISAAVYLSLGLMIAETDPRLLGRICLLAFMCLMVILIGCTRVYLGVHWPSDVVAGWCLGTVWALMVFAAMRWLRRNGQADGD
ncbi:phosphatase PAP2 family protein [Phenylobacterium sp. LjRoot225]|uniref:phosphatase PAP2 family protein n=1 Tax=Phenylobacterium sp. LjRoot225 TaxID=3342285 RepID=UPI003ED136D9